MLNTTNQMVREFARILSPMRQHDSHVWTRTEWQILCIYAALDLVWPDDTLAAWYACGDELI